MKMIWLYAAWTLSLVGFCTSARILVIQPSQIKSHIIVSHPLIEELAARGHQVTFITSYPHKPPLPNLRDIDISYKLPPKTNFLAFEEAKRVMPSPFIIPYFFTNAELLGCELLYPELSILGFFNSNETYDLVITESLTSDCYVPFAHKFRAPLISFITSSVLPWTAGRLGLPDNPSYIPNYLVALSSEMTLLEKIYNTITLVSAKLAHRFYTLPRTQILVNKYFGDSLPPLDQLLRNTSMIFVNSYFSMSVNRPFPPNFVEIGGIHIRSPSLELSKDFQEILDEATQGAVVVSFGSLLRTATVPQQVITMFLRAFSTIPHTVIFKYEETLTDVPHNVIVRKWLPQQQLVAHKNVRLLITHGGLSSTIEAVHFGKPIIGVPFFADQFLNVKGMVRRGAGLMLDVQDLTQQKIEEAIKEVLTNTSYTRNIERLSQQFRDRPMTPLQTAVYWTEYVIRHQGAPHLQPASVHLPLYQYLLLDVLTVLLLPLLALVYFVYFCLIRGVHACPSGHRNTRIKKFN